MGGGYIYIYGTGKESNVWDEEIIQRLGGEDNSTLGQEDNHAKMTPQQNVFDIHEVAIRTTFLHFQKCIMHEIERST